MDTCNRCGGEIIIRYMNGVPRPIHLSGGCSGGSGGSGISTRTVSVPETRVYSESTDGFCRATICPTCGGEVFFVRHNGGSVWFDELGWPWPKHGCFDNLHVHVQLPWVEAATSQVPRPDGALVVRT